MKSILLLTLAMSAQSFAANPTRAMNASDANRSIPNFESLNIEDLSPALDEAEAARAGGIPDSCKKINPTDQQKAAYKDAVYQSTKKRNLLIAQIKNAKLDWLQNALNTGGTAANAESASKVAVSSATEMIQNKADLTNNIIFNILTVEQRQPALECMKALQMKKAHKKAMSKCHQLHRGRGGSTETETPADESTIDDLINI